MTDMLSQDTRKDYPLRVLVVDNDSTDRMDHAEDLSEWGYTPIVAEGEGRALFEDARRKVREYRCHAAIVDMRLFDDKDISDRSGLELVPQLKPAKCIVVTGYGSLPASRKANEYSAAIVGKEEGSEAVHGTLQDAVKEYWHTNIQIVWIDNWSPLQIAQELKGLEDLSKDSGDEIEDLIRLLFPSATRVRMQRLNTAVVSVHAMIRRTSVIALATETQEIPGSESTPATEIQKIPVIVKLMRAKSAQQEETCFSRYIQGRIGGNRTAALIRSRILWDFGGNVYSLIGYTLDDEGDQKVASYAQTFYARFQSSNVSTSMLENSIRQLVTSIWSRYYNNIEKHTAITLFEEYDQAYDRLLTKDVRNESDSSLSEFLQWLRNHKDDSRLPAVSKTVIHGDWHANNILIDSTGYPWIIDFERTGPGHALRDFITLTRDILTRMLPLKGEGESLLDEFVVSLCSVRRPNERIVPTESIISIPAAYRAFRIISYLHELAYEVTQYSDYREYLWGLLLESTAFAIVIAENDPRRGRALRIGNIVRKRLEIWDQPQRFLQSWPEMKWVNTNLLAEHELQRSVSLGHLAERGKSLEQTKDSSSRKKIQASINTIMAKLQDLGEYA